MIYRILFFLFLFGTLHADSTRLAPEAEPLALVHGCVSLIKGEFIQRRTDLLIEGPSPLSLTRICDSGSAQAKSSLGLGFTWAVAKDLWRAGYTWDVCALEEREGIELYYRNVGTEASPRFEVDPRAFRVGYTSYSRGEISGVNNLHNVVLTPRGGELKRYWNASRGAQSWLTGGEWVVTLGCGAQRIYSWKAQPERHWWQLSKEIRPDGNKVLYEYDQNNRVF